MFAIIVCAVVPRCGSAQVKFCDVTPLPLLFSSHVSLLFTVHLLFSSSSAVVQLSSSTVFQLSYSAVVHCSAVVQLSSSAVVHCSAVVQPNVYQNFCFTDPVRSTHRLDELCLNAIKSFGRNNYWWRGGGHNRVGGWVSEGGTPCGFPNQWSSSSTPQAGQCQTEGNNNYSTETALLTGFLYN